MSKSCISLLAILFWVTNLHAQEHCGTTIMYNRYLQEYPAINYYHQKAAANTLRVTGASSPDNYYNYIPVVVHIIHNYGAEYISDDSVYAMIDEMNNAFSTGDTAGVLLPFKKYVGKSFFRFRLATKDTSGHPTKGITRTYSYLTYGGNDQAKFNAWAASKYLNIWIVNSTGLGTPVDDVGAYAMYPDAAEADTLHDGVVCNYRYMNTNTIKPMVLEHAIGHYLGLYHTWDSTGTIQCGVACGDDGVDDTPPTKGHCGVCALYDSMCATGYKKHYPSGEPNLDSIVDYPDTANVQNIMDLSSCPKMFTKGQFAKLEGILFFSQSIRAQLINYDTSTYTLPDLPPVAAYSVNKRFICAGHPVIFQNRSWNDTITNVNWQFSLGASTPSVSPADVNLPVVNSFSQSGWVTVSIAATGNNTATNTLVDSQAVYVADNNAINAVNYYQEFNPTTMSNWPIFNYYNNNFKWSVVNFTGYYDNTCLRYEGFDTRVDPVHNKYPATGMPQGDYDDIFSPAFDLTGLTNSSLPVSLNFMYSGASRTSNIDNMTDTLEIDYTTDCTNTWHVLSYLGKQNLDNQGVLSIAYAPQTQLQWSLRSIPLPTDAITNHTIFRFRYKPGVFASYATTGLNPYSTGNDFYIDRLNFSNDLLGLNTLIKDNNDVALAPNPTNGSSYVVVKNITGSLVSIQVTDIAGRIVYTTQQQVSGIGKIEIPQRAIAATGMYLVHVSMSGQTSTHKLVVY